MTSRSVRALRGVLRTLERFVGEEAAAPASSEFMRGYRKGREDAWRSCAEWIVEAVPELQELPEPADRGVLDRRRAAAS